MCPCQLLCAQEELGARVRGPANNRPGPNPPPPPSFAHFSSRTSLTHPSPHLSRSFRQAHAVSVSRERHSLLGADSNDG